MKEWREVTFMKEWVKALYIGYHQALDLPKNLFLFPRTGHLKISLGPTQFLCSKFHSLLKLIFHTNQYSTMAPNSSVNWVDEYFEYEHFETPWRNHIIATNAIIQQLSPAV